MLGVILRSMVTLLHLFSLQRKNTIFGSRPRVERRLTSSTARGSSRMFYRLIFKIY